MEKEKLLKYVAPCSLLCYTCMGCKDGAIPEYAGKLYNCMQGVGEFRASHMPENAKQEWYSFFDGFMETLDNFTKATCPGCRVDPQHGSTIGDCIIPDCVKEHGVDFCAECNEFPCQKAKNFCAGHTGLNKVWENNNRRISEIGIEAYFEENKDVSHYIHHKKAE